MTNQDPCLRTTLKFFSKYFTIGFAIKEIIQPRTNGIKKRIIFGITKTINNIVNIYIPNFIIVFKCLEGIITLLSAILILPYKSEFFFKFIFSFSKDEKLFVYLNKSI